jgi:hypothetical protein
MGVNWAVLGPTGVPFFRVPAWSALPKTPVLIPFDVFAARIAFIKAAAAVPLAAV